MRSGKIQILVSTMYVNNEIGTLEPIEEIGKIIKEKNPKALWHVDAIQAYGKYRIYPKKLGIDMLSVSGHKLHDQKELVPLCSKRSEDPSADPGRRPAERDAFRDRYVPGIAGLGCAAKEAYTDFDKKVTHLCELKQFFMEEVQKIPDTVLNSLPGDQGAPHIVSVSFAGVRSEVLLHALEERGIQVSSGSACSSNKKLPVSPVLKEIGLKKDLLDSTVRFSFCENTTKEELEYCLQQLKELLMVLRRYSRH